MTARWRSSRSPVIVLLAVAAIVSACSTTMAPSPSREPTAASTPSHAAPTTSVDGSLPPTATAMPPIATAELRPVGPGPVGMPEIADISATPDGFVGLGVTPEPRASLVLSGSTDGWTWTRQDGSAFGAELSGIAPGPLGWVAAQGVATTSGAGAATVLWFSADGRTWQQLPDQAGLATSFPGPLAAGPLGFAMIGQVEMAGNSVSALWTSGDGRTWSEVESMREAGLDHVVISSRGFVGVRTGIGGGTPSMWLSPDGTAWTVATTSGETPVGHVDTSITVPVQVGSALLVVQGGAPTTPLSVWLGTLDPAGGGRVAWQHQATADDLLRGAAVVTAVAVPGGVDIFGYDRSTLVPLVLTSADGKAWHREDLAAGTFGGGVPDLIVSSDRSVVAVGSDASQKDVAGPVPQLWRSDDGIAWTPATDSGLATGPSHSPAPCPATRPATVESILAMDRSDAVRCFGHDALTIEGFVTGCGGCGGTSAVAGVPSWLLDPLGYSAFWLAGAVVPASTGGGGFGVWIDPAHPIAVPAAGTHVFLTGHFDDPAAATCRLVPLVRLGVPLPNPGDAVATCRRSFVASKIRLVKP